MNISCFFAALGLLLKAMSLSVSGQSTPWPHDSSDLSLDPKVVTGKLDNGLRYLIYPDAGTEPGRVSLRLYLHAGSLMEHRTEQGVAHFLEHLAFNGSSRTSSDQLAEKFQRLGINLGPHGNSESSFDRTVYKLDLPKADSATILTGLQFFRDSLDGMLLGRPDISKERNTVLKELSTTDTVEMRRLKAELKFALPETVIGHRLPMGSVDSVKNLIPEALVNYYHRWYNPSRAVVIAVGDVNATEIEELIKTEFATAITRTDKLAEPTIGQITKGRGFAAQLHTDPKARDVQVSLEVLQEYNATPDSAGRRSMRLVRRLASAMLQQRLTQQIQSGQAPYRSAVCNTSELFQFTEANAVMATCNPQQWQAALITLEQQVRRAVQEGFTSEELAAVKENLRTEQDTLRALLPTRSQAALADQAVEHIANGQVLMDADGEAALTDAILAAVTAEDCTNSLREVWQNSDVLVFVSGNISLEQSSARVAQVYAQSAARPLPALPNDPTPSQTLTKTTLSKPGLIASVNVARDLGITQAVLGNQIRLNAKQSDFDKDTVFIAVTFGGGLQEAPQDKPGLAAYAPAVFINGGLESLSLAELNQRIAGRQINANFIVADDCFALISKTTPADLEAQLQLLSAYLSSPGYREESNTQLQQQLDAIYRKAESSPEGLKAKATASFVYGNDARYTWPKREDLEKRTLSEVKEWLSQPLKNSYLEISIIGDVPVETTLTAVAKTLGTLPPRAGNRADYAGTGGAATHTEPSTEKSQQYAAATARAHAMSLWAAGTRRDEKTTLGLSFLGQVLNDRLRQVIHDKSAQVVYHTGSFAPSGRGYLTAEAPANQADQLPKISQYLVQMVSSIGQSGIPEEEFKRARGTYLQKLASLYDDNGYWLDQVLVNSQAEPWRLDLARTMFVAASKISKAELESMAKEYLQPSKAMTVTLYPSTAVATSVKNPAKDQPAGGGSSLGRPVIYNQSGGVPMESQVQANMLQQQRPQVQPQQWQNQYRITPSHRPPPPPQAGFRPRGGPPPRHYCPPGHRH